MRHHVPSLAALTSYQARLVARFVERLSPQPVIATRDSATTGLLIHCRDILDAGPTGGTGNDIPFGAAAAGSIPALTRNRA